MEKLHCQEKKFHIIQFVKTMSSIGPDGNPVASIFTYAYFRSDVEDTANRPVVFAYNGGPGSSCMYVHAGFLGTRRMQYDEVDRESAFRHLIKSLIIQIV